MNAEPPGGVAEEGAEGGIRGGRRSSRPSASVNTLWWRIANRSRSRRLWQLPDAERRDILWFREAQASGWSRCQVSTTNAFA